MESYVRMLRGLREERGVNQVDVAKELGVTQQYYSAYENGEHEIPVRHLLTLADYYNVSLDFIMGRTKSRQSVDVLNKAVTERYTVGELVSDVVGLDDAGRIATAEFVRFQRNKNL